jgi:sulfide:quinone oxidoreductase
VLGYDVLVVATGVRLLPEETDGLTGPGWRERVFTFYDLEGATALREALAHFDGGRLVVNIADMPIKCPVAPIEFAFLVDWHLRERGIRERSEVVLSTPLDACFTKPIASEHLTHLLAEKEIELVTEFAAGAVDGVGGKLLSYDEREISFDLLVTVPLHGGAAYVGRSPGLGDALDFVPANAHTLQSKARPNVFVIGDAADLPISKAGVMSIRCRSPSNSRSNTRLRWLWIKARRRFSARAVFGKPPSSGCARSTFRTSRSYTARYRPSFDAK